MLKGALQGIFSRFKRGLKPELGLEERPTLVERHFHGKLCQDAEVIDGIIVTSVLEESEQRLYPVFICNFASSWWTSQQAGVWFPRDARVMIRNPYLSFNKNGSPCLELLNPGFIKVLGFETQEELENEEELENSAEKSLEDGQFIRAAHLFSACLESGKKKNDTQRQVRRFSRRCEAWLNAGYYEKALADSNSALELYPDDSQNILRLKGAALMGLHQYTAALYCFKSSKLATENSNEMKRCQSFVENSLSGKLDLEDYYLNNEARESSPEFGDFVGPVTIRSSLDCGGGRGLFATRDIKAGEAIFFCNPLAAMFHENRLPLEDDLVAEMVRNCITCRRNLQQLVSLVDSEDVPDIELFKANSGYQLTREQEELLDLVDIPACVRKTSIDYGYKFERFIGPGREREFLSGLWILTAFANHSCAPSACQKAVGSGSLVRAGRGLSSGEEVTLAYLDPLTPWDVRNKSFRTRWGYECRCERCRFESGLHSSNPRTFGVGLKMEKLVEEGSNLALFKVSEMAWRVESKVSEWEEEKHRNWIRASYYKAYQVYLVNRVVFDGFMERPVAEPAEITSAWESLMEALYFTAPGFEGMLGLLLLLRMHISGSRRANEVVRLECLSRFGDLSDRAMDRIIEREADAIVVEEEQQEVQP